jgi:hypothetical protein
MRIRGLRGKVRRRFRVTTDSEHGLAVAPNTLGRRFDVERPDQVWASDITFVPLEHGVAYLAVIMDLFSRRVVGWALAEHMRTELVETALEMALGARVPQAGMLHHSDRGCQYASLPTASDWQSSGSGQHEPHRRLLRQRRGRELLRHAQAGARARRTLGVVRPGPCGDHDYIEVFYNESACTLVWATSRRLTSKQTVARERAA